MNDSDLHVPYQLRRGKLRGDEEASVMSGLEILEVVAEDLGLADLASVDLLDIGCGVKFTQAILKYDIPIRSYTGLDIASDLIGYLRDHVDDDRFRFEHSDWHNELYNKTGIPLGPDTQLPVGDETYDAITAFSVMTHLVPDDFLNLLRSLRPHLRPSGRLIFSAFLDRLTPGGHGFMDGLVKQLGPEAHGSVDGFRDLDEREPLKWAMYTEDFARELIDRAGWTVVEMVDPTPTIQHRFICVPP